MIENTMHDVHAPTPAELQEFFSDESQVTQAPAPATSLPSSLLLAALEALIDARVAIAIGALPKTPAAERIEELERKLEHHEGLLDKNNDAIEDLRSDVAEHHERLKTLEDDDTDIEDAVREALDGAEISVTINRRRY